MHSVRLKVFICAFCFPLACLGNGHEFMGQSRLFKITITSTHLSHATVIVAKAYEDEDGFHEQQSLFSFSSECAAANINAETQFAHTFKCRSKGKSPLAGASYELRDDSNPTCEGTVSDYRYVCVKGCNYDITPKYLFISRNEC